MEALSKIELANVASEKHRVNPPATDSRTICDLTQNCCMNWEPIYLTARLFNLGIPFQQSLIPVGDLSKTELHGLLAFLTEWSPSRLASASKTVEMRMCVCLFFMMSLSMHAQVTFQDLLKPPAENWLSYSGDLTGRRHSLLTQI